jgi:pimeloyl-ACP methyl ester carboxylesterase
MFAVADAAGPGRLIVVGFSMAGRFCRSMSSLDESRILGQVLVAPLGPDPLAIPSDAFAGWLEAAPFPERYRPILDQFIAKPVREDLKELYCANVARASRAALVGTISMWYEPLAKEIGRARVPTLVIAGEHDPVLTLAYVKEQILGRTPGARMVTLPCGHEIPIEMPSDMAWLLEAFLAASQNA